MCHSKRYPKPADLIQITRCRFKHWALYLGDGYVIHVARVDKGAPALSGSAMLVVMGQAKAKKQLLKEVVGNDYWRINNKYDRSHAPLPVVEIIPRAESYIDREVPYDLLDNNCEHFVTMLRYGEKVSDQVTNFLAVVMVAVLVAAVAVPIMKRWLRDTSEKKKK